MDRPRACAAIINDGNILMVCHRTPTRVYWTLPGGGVHDGEMFEQAATREVMEETHLNVKIVKLLFVEDYQYGKSYCYLAELTDNTEPTIGYDPEGLSEFNTTLESVAWHSLKDMKDDIQVSKVMSSLSDRLKPGT